MSDQDLAAQAEAEEEKAFNEAMGIGSPTVEEPPAEGEDLKQTETPEAPKQDLETPKLFAGYSESQIQEMFNKVQRVDSLESQLAKAHGHIGEMKAWRDRQKPVVSQPAPIDKLAAALEAEGYVEIAEVFKKVMGEKVEAPPPEETKEDPLATGQHLEAERARLESEKQIAIQQERTNLVKSIHSDFDTVRTSNEFVTFVNALKEPDRTEFLNSWDPALIVKRLGEFKNWQADKKSEAKKHIDRLTAAANPRGVPKTSHSMSEEDEEEAAFQSELKKRR